MTQDQIQALCWEKLENELNVLLNLKSKKKYQQGRSFQKLVNRWTAMVNNGEEYIEE